MTLSIVIIVLVLVLAFVIFKAAQLQKLHIQKSVIINGSSQEVFDMVRYLNNFPKWSPFLAEDPTQKIEVKGTDGQVGAQYHWEGNKGKDLGYQEIAKIESPNFISLQCDIQKPFVAKPSFNYSFSKTPTGIKVTQDFNLESDLVSSIFMFLFGAKKEMAAMNAKGLAMLKKAVEK